MKVVKQFKTLFVIIFFIQFYFVGFKKKFYTGTHLISSNEKMEELREEVIPVSYSSPSSDDAGQRVIHKGPPGIVVTLLENFTGADIIVNPTDKNLQLFYGGEISNTILRIAGQNIQSEINTKYPRGIEPGEIAVTQGYNLRYKYVYHCSLQNIKERVSHHEIREVVTECLKTAVKEFKENRRGKPTIAFPAIGTGAMNFPPIIIKTIYCTILEFMQENPHSLEEAYVIVHPSKTELIDYLKKIDRDEEIKRLTYPVQFPSWSGTDDISRVKLEESDSSYKSVVKKFLATIKKSVRIIKIERIENKRLFVAYERYKNTIPNGQSTEKELWHGTKESSINSIIRYGFDWRLTERAAYGKGCYFAVEATYSDQEAYAASNDQGEKYMFLAYVVAGQARVGNPSYSEWEIPNTVQSTVNNIQNPTIYVTYNDDQMYPAFLVVYKRT